MGLFFVTCCKTQEGLVTSRDIPSGVREERNATMAICAQKFEVYLLQQSQNQGNPTQCLLRHSQTYIYCLVITVFLPNACSPSQWSPFQCPPPSGPVPLLVVPFQMSPPSTFLLQWSPSLPLLVVHCVSFPSGPLPSHPSPSQSSFPLLQWSSSRWSLPLLVTLLSPSQLSLSLPVVPLIVWSLSQWSLLPLHTPMPPLHRVSVHYHGLLFICITSRATVTDM